MVSTKTMPKTQPMDADAICPECNYNLTGVIADRCPWCGWRIDPDQIISSSDTGTNVRRLATLALAMVLGCGSLITVTFLMGRAQTLGLLDGVTVLAVVMAGAGHLALAVLAIRGVGQWPLPQRELGQVLRFVACFSVVCAIAGAFSVLYAPPREPSAGVVVVSSVFEFALYVALFSFPGWTLFGLTLASFRGRPGTALPRRVTSADGDAKCDVGPPFVVEVFGRYAPEQVTQRWEGRCWSVPPEDEDKIAGRWQEALVRAEQSGASLFNGELVRLNSFDATAQSLHLSLGPTCFRDFLGTNLCASEVPAPVDVGRLANAIGVSAMVRTSDGYLALGRRSQRVAYHGGLLHLFGGMLEPADKTAEGPCDPFATLRRELHEELGIDREAIGDVMLVGLVRDGSIVQPELIFDVETTLPRDALVACFESDSVGGEHTAIEFVYDEPDAVTRFFDTAAPMTPVAQAGLLLHGRHEWGESWYEQTCWTRYGALPSKLGE